MIALAGWATSAQAALVFVQHDIFAETSISARVKENDPPRDGVLFDRSVVSTGLSGQGQVSSASAAQSVFFDERHGAFGNGTASLSLSSGVTGQADSFMQSHFIIDQRSTYSIQALFEAQGNAGATSDLELLLLGDTDVSIFDFDLTTPSVNQAGFLDAGSYLLRIRTRVASADPGESGSSRFDFNFRFDALQGNNELPEPQSLALVLAALVPALSLRRRLH